MVDTVDEPFQVVVDSCMATLDLSLVQIDLIENTWYNDMMEYDLSQIQYMVIPSVECGYPFTFEVVQVVFDQFNVETEIPLPKEISFEYDQVGQTMMMTIAKCSPIGVSNGDPECEGKAPHRKDWTLRMHIGLVQEN